jgi:hypothetical protein
MDTAELLIPRPTLGDTLERVRLEHRIGRLRATLLILERRAAVHEIVPSHLADPIAALREELEAVRERLRRLA